MRACNFIKKKLQRKFIPVKLEKFLRALFLTEHFRWLLLKLLFFFTLKYTCVSKRRDAKNWSITLLIKQVLFSFKMKKYASFAEMNMIPITTPKAQLLPFVTHIYWNLWQALFLPYKKILPAMCFFLWLFNPFDYRDNQQLVFISIYKCSI